METSVFKQAVKLLREQKKYRRWLTTFLCLAVLVTLGTVAALKMNGQALNHKKQVLNCQLELHEHTDSCYDGDKLVCGYADYVVHTHNDDCYGADGELICQLPEVEAHEHSDDCYEEEKVLVCGLDEIESEVHEHTEDCYIKEKGELICGEEEGGGAEADSSSDESDESEDNGDGEEGEDGESEEPKAQSEESSGHEHTDDCYEWNDVLACEAGSGEEGHTHTDECYETKTVLACGKAELHTHDEEACYDENGSLTCGLLEVKEHIHGEECFETVDMTDEEVAGLNAKLTKTFEDDYVRVTAEYSESADLPADAVLKVEQITDEDHFAEREAELREELDDENITMGALMNIGFYVTDEETGKDVEVEPKDAVSITIQFLDNEGFAEGDPITIVHFADEGTEVLDGSKIDGEKTTTFEMSSFSDIAVLNDNARNVSGVYMWQKTGEQWEKVGEDLTQRISDDHVVSYSDSDSDKILTIDHQLFGGYAYQLTDFNGELPQVDGVRWFACAIKDNEGIKITTIYFEVTDREGGIVIGGRWVADSKDITKENIIGFYYLPGNMRGYENEPLENIGSSYQIVFNPGNGNITEAHPQYGNIPRTTISIPESATRKEVGADGTETVKVDLRLPSDEDLVDVAKLNDTNTPDFIFSTNDESITGKVGKEIGGCELKLVGWLNVATDEYYNVENGPVIATIDLSDTSKKNVFYADWIAEDYNFYDGTSKVKEATEEDTDGFITTRVFDFNELFNIYSASWSGTNASGGEIWSLEEKYKRSNINSMVFLYDLETIDAGGKGALARPSGTGESEGNHNNGRFADGFWGIESPEDQPIQDLFSENNEAFGVHYIGRGNHLYSHIYKEGEVGYYEYDSGQNAASYQQKDGRFYVSDEPQYILYKDRNVESFLPFNDNETYVVDSGGINYHFGISSEVMFYLRADINAEDGGNQVDGEDMIFEFSGDDDVWVFVDDELILDMGGIHGALGGRINFSQGKVEYGTRIGNTPGSNAISWEENEEDSGKLKSIKKGEHKLTIYYMERGAGLSNCKIKFNIAPRYMLEPATASTVSVEKKWVPENTEKMAVTIRLKDSEGNDLGKEVTLDEGNGWKYTWEGLDPDKKYSVEEDEIERYISTKKFQGAQSHKAWADTDALENEIIILNSTESSSLIGGAKALQLANGVIQAKNVQVEYGVLNPESISDDITWIVEKAGDEGYYLKNKAHGKYLYADSSTNTVTVSDTYQQAFNLSSDAWVRLCFNNDNNRIIYEDGKFKCSPVNTDDKTHENSQKISVRVFRYHDVTSEVRNYTVTNTYLPMIAIYKVDSETNKNLPGAMFTLTGIREETIEGSDGKPTTKKIYSLYDGEKWTEQETEWTGEEIKAAAFTSSGITALDKLPDGTYTLTETKSPSGYKLPEGEKAKIIFVVNEAKIKQVVSSKLSGNSEKYIAEIKKDSEGEDRILLVRNESSAPTDIQVKFIKTNRVSSGSSGGEFKLNNAEFELYRVDEEGTDSISGVADKLTKVENLTVSGKDKDNNDSEDGVFYTGKLPMGTYYLKETKAPDGYELPTDVFKFSIEYKENNIQINFLNDASEKLLQFVTPKVESDPYVIKVSNTPGFKLPETGGNGTIPITMGSAILMTVSAFLLYGYSMRQKKRERRSNK